MQVAHGWQTEPVACLQQAMNRAMDRDSKTMSCSQADLQLQLPVCTLHGRQAYM